MSITQELRYKYHDLGESTVAWMGEYLDATDFVGRRPWVERLFLTALRYK